MEDADETISKNLTARHVCILLFKVYRWNPVN